MPATALFLRHRALVLSACSPSAATMVVWKASGLYRTKEMNWPSAVRVPYQPSALAALRTVSSSPVRMSNTLSAPSGIWLTGRLQAARESRAQRVFYACFINSFFTKIFWVLFITFAIFVSKNFNNVFSGNTLL